MTTTFVRTLRVLPLWLTLIAVASLAVTGCAHVDSRTRTSRALIGAGVATVVVGALIAGGCVDPSEGDGCSGSPEGADVAGGLPLMAAGAAMIAGGVAVRPKDTGVMATPAVPTTPLPVASNMTEERNPAGNTPVEKVYSPGPRIELLQGEAALREQEE